MINVIKKLKKHGICFTKGLTKEEVSKIEDIYDIIFPPDLLELYSLGLPISSGFVNWRDFGENNIRIIKERMRWPINGLISDVKSGEIWLDTWGEKCLDTIMAIKKIITLVDNSPKLIPIFSHRYIPTIPSEYNNPVFSVYHSDIIYYGINICDYFEREFFMKKESIMYKDVKKIKFWSDIAENG